MTFYNLIFFFLINRLDLNSHEAFQGVSIISCFVLLCFWCVVVFVFVVIFCFLSVLCSMHLCIVHKHLAI